ncbi:MAG TPA: hypothetical protein VKB57_28580 [Acidimicrobiales bacterium]|nr:hypothetical protein [Acidimicrobiales bacterium]
MILSPPPPVPAPGAGLVVAGRTLDLRARVLVAGVVPAPRFGREGEVLATAAAVRAAGADLVDVSLPARLLGPVARAGGGSVAARAATAGEAAAARRAGADVVLVPPAVAGDLDLGGDLAPGAVAVLIDDLAGLDEARALADGRGLVLAVDAARWQGPEAVAREAAAVALGCRLVRTADVRRSRRVAEVMAALLGARR